jgi:hypothetical protein
LFTKYVKKYKALEENMYKRMFNNGDSTQKSERLTDSNSKVFDDETKAFIKKRLSDFKNNDDMKTFKISYETYPKEMVDFIIQQAKNMSLVTRIIQGVSLNFSKNSMLNLCLEYFCRARKFSTL